MQPAAVLDLRLIGAAVVVIGTGDRHALGDDRLGRRGDHLVIRAAGAHRVVGQAVELLIFAVAHDQAVVAVPQHEGFGDRLHGVAKPRILVGRAGSEVLLGNHGDAGQARLAIRKGPRDVPAQPESDKVTVGVAQPEAAVEHRRALAETPVDLAPQIVVGMQSLGDGTEGHRLTGRLEPEEAVHRRGPVHVAPREVPAPDAATRQRLGQLLGERAVIGARGARGEIPQPARKQGEHEAGQGEQGNFQARRAAPLRQCRIDRLDKGELRVGLRHIADRDDGVGSVEQREAQHPGLGAKRGEWLLGAENREQVPHVRTAERRTRLDRAFGIGQ